MRILRNSEAWAETGRPAGRRSGQLMLAYCEGLGYYVFTPPTT